MRLWHIELIPKLPSKKDYKGCSNQLGGQHTEIRMILGKIKKCGKVNHSTVNYVNNYSVSHLYAYGLVVIDEMKKRGFNVSQDIINEYTNNPEALNLYYDYVIRNKPIFVEHDDCYLAECIVNLKSKNINIERGLRRGLIVIHNDYWNDINDVVNDLNDEDFDKILIESGIEKCPLDNEDLISFPNTTCNIIEFKEVLEVD